MYPWLNPQLSKHCSTVSLTANGNRERKLRYGKEVIYMANLLISGVFSKTQDGKDGVVRQFKSAVSDAVKRHDGKVSQFSIDNGIITISIDDEAVANKLKDELKDLEGATVTVVGSALEALVGRLNSQKSARA